MMKLKNTALAILTILFVACLSMGISGCEFLAIPNKKVKHSEGLEFQLNEEGESYTVTGIGVCTDTDVVIPNTYENLPVTAIGENAFEFCENLTRIVIPDSVVVIGESAFYSCESLNSVEMGDRVAVIGGWAFADCTRLTSVEIVDSVIIVGEWAFSNCTNLTSVEIGDNVTVIGELVFSNCENLTEINVAKNNVNYKAIDGNLYSKDGTIFLQYASGKEQTTFTLPEDVITIGAWAFDHCCLENIEIGANVETISTSAFYYCDGLTSVVIPDNVITIGDAVFFECLNLTSVVIGKNVFSIGSLAFAHCPVLTSVVIGESVRSIQGDAFYECERLTTVYYQGTESDWERVKIGDEDECLTAAIIYYYRENTPTESGNFWHFNANGEVEIWS